MGRFDGLAGVTATRPKLYFQDGNFVVDILKFKWIDAEDTQKKKDTVVVETRVVESDNPALGVGSLPSQVITVDPQYPTYALSDMKQVFGAVQGITDPDAFQAEVEEEDKIASLEIGLDPQTCANDRYWRECGEALVSVAQPAAGIRIKLHVYTKTTQKGKKVTKHLWGPVIVG